VNRSFVFRGVRNRSFARSRHGWLYGVPENKCDSQNNGKTGKKWTKIGAAFPHKEGAGFNIELKAFPVDGRLVVLPPDPNDDRSK
jgi:hypothetical protein